MQGQSDGVMHLRMGWQVGSTDCQEQAQLSGGSLMRRVVAFTSFTVIGAVVAVVAPMAPLLGVALSGFMN
jgi:hypothetical protein